MKRITSNPPCYHVLSGKLLTKVLLTNGLILVTHDESSPSQSIQLKLKLCSTSFRTLAAEQDLFLIYRCQSVTLGNPDGKERRCGMNEARGLRIRFGLVSANP